MKFRRYKFIYAFLLGLFLVVACKKETNIQVSVFNPNVHENTKGATIELIEEHNGNCNVVSSSITDENGMAVFKAEKLKRKKGYKYFCFVQSAWGIDSVYDCSESANRIEVGKTNELNINEYRTGKVQLKLYNIFNGGTYSDSLLITMNKLIYPNKLSSNTVIGDQLPIAYQNLFLMNSPYIPQYYESEVLEYSGDILVTINSRKSFISTVKTKIIRVYPNTNTTISLDWESF